MNQNSQAAHNLAHESIGAKLRIAIDNLSPQGVRLAELRDVFGRDGLMLLTIFLTIPFMVPVSIPGVSTVFGSAILLIGVSRLLDRNLWLPKRIEERELPSDKLRAGLNQGLLFFQRLEGFTRPHRMERLMSDSLANSSLVLAALLLMVPFGFVPFSNTLPGLALLLLAIGLLQRDGGCILVGHIVNVATIVYFAMLVVGSGALVTTVLQWFGSAG